MSPESQNQGPSELRPGDSLAVGEVSFLVRKVLRRAPPREAEPRQTLLVAQALSGPHAPRLALIRCLEGPQEAPARQRAAEGGRLALHLRHRHIRQLWQVLDTPPCLFLVSEHLPGHDLESVASLGALSQRPLPPELVCFIGAAVADALDHVHALTDDTGQPLGIIHRGINLENIHLGPTGEVKLTGFDSMFSRMHGRRVTPRPVLRGDMAYISPEYVIHGQQDSRGDVFSLGMVLLELLAGRHPLDDPNTVTPVASTAALPGTPFTAEQPTWWPLEVLAVRLVALSPDIVAQTARGAPAPVIAILQQALQRSPEERYPTAGRMRDDLRAWLARLPAPYTPEVAVEDVRRMEEHLEELRG